MWTTIAFNIILSFVIIIITHQLWEYCKVNYTSQKTKNLVEIHASKYKQIAEDMERNSSQALISVPVQTPGLVKIQPAEFLPLDEKEWVHKELTAFIDTL
jgi:hypothetical protein